VWGSVLIELYLLRWAWGFIAHIVNQGVMPLPRLPKLLVSRRERGEGGFIKFTPLSYRIELLQHTAR